jgi:hypothetical protein
LTNKKEEGMWKEIEICFTILLVLFSNEENARQVVAELLNPDYCSFRHICTSVYTVYTARL